MKIGIFGGTFDPPHVGHLIAAQDACTALSLDRLFFVPAAIPPHKQNLQVSPAPTRIAMLQQALKSNDVFELCTLEVERSGPSYTVDTLRELKQKMPTTSFVLLLGVDQIRDFGSWRGPDEIMELAEVVMLTRQDAQAGEAAPFVKEIVEVTRVDLSSTLIRQRVRDGQPIRYMVPDGVEEIIRRERLYLAV